MMFSALDDRIARGTVVSFTAAIDACAPMGRWPQAMGLRSLAGATRSERSSVARFV